MEHHQETGPAGRSSSQWKSGTGGFVAALLCCFAVLAAFSFIHVPLPGINEPHYLSKARAFADPSWCEGDLFLESANAHYVFFAITGPLTQVLPLPAVAVAGRLLSLLLMAYGWVRLAGQLQLNRPGTVLAAALWCGIGLTGNLSGEWVLGGYEGKVPAYGFALAGSARWLQAFRSRSWKQYATAGAWLGLSVSLHPVVGAWFCVAIALVELLLHLRSPIGSERRSFTQFLRDGLVFVGSSTALALPGLIPAVAMLLGGEMPAEKVDRANYIQVFWRLKHHLDPTEFPLSAWLHTTVLLLVAGIAHLLVRSRMHRGMGDTDSQDAAGRKSDVHLAAAISWKQWWVLLLISACIVAAGVAVGWHSKPILQTEGWQWRASLLKFYPFRLFDALLPMTTALAVARLLTPPTMVQRRARVVLLTIAVLIATYGSAAMQRRQAPPGYSPAAFRDWRVACRWMQQHLPQGALVLAPREAFGFSWYAHRAQYVCFKDCPQDTPGILEWNSRLWDIHNWSEAAYRDETYQAADTVKLYEKFGITHIITRQLGPFERPPVYSNQTWRIYETQ